MAEQIKTEKRTIEEILNELFEGRDAALSKYAKVRFTLYEMNLWREYDARLRDVAGSAKAYFSKKFLKGVKIKEASEDQLNEAFKRLKHAVYDGCHGRCIRLVEELNIALQEKHLVTIKKPEVFLDWLTFDYSVLKDEYGNPRLEPGYSFEIRIFHDSTNRKELWFLLRGLIKENEMISMQDAHKIISFKRSCKIVQLRDD